MIAIGIPVSGSRRRTIPLMTGSPSPGFPANTDTTLAPSAPESARNAGMKSETPFGASSPRRTGDCARPPESSRYAAATASIAAGMETAARTSSAESRIRSTRSLLVHERIPVARGRHERLLHAPGRDPAEEVQRRAGLVVRPARPASAEGLLPHDGAG